MSDYFYKPLRDILPKFKKIQNSNTLELSVQNDNSTNILLEIYKKNNGYLTFIDINNCLKFLNYTEYNFILSKYLNCSLNFSFFLSSLKLFQKKIEIVWA
jgi:hypothetical protein